MRIGNVAYIASDRLITEDITLNVPSQYPTPQAALDALVGLTPAPGVTATINLESGYKLPSGNLGVDREATFYVNGVDMGWVVITSEDAVVDVVDEFEGSVLIAVRCNAPVLACLIDMDGKGLNGYVVEKGGTGYVKVNCGVINAGSIGLYSRQGSSVYAARGEEDPNAGVNFSGADIGAYVNHSSRAYLRQGDFSNCTTVGIRVRHASTVDAPGTKVDGSATGILSANASMVNVADGSVRNCSLVGVMSTDGSTVNAVGINADGCEETLRAINGSIIVANASVLTNCTTRVCEARNMSKVSIRGSTLDEPPSGNALSLTNGSIVDATGLGTPTANVPYNELTVNGILFG